MGVQCSSIVQGHSMSTTGTTETAKHGVVGGSGRLSAAQPYGPIALVRLARDLPWTDGDRLGISLSKAKQLVLVEGLPVVFNADGEQIGDLVWRSRGARVTVGEFALVVEQLRRLEEPDVGMELQYSDTGAVVFRDGEMYGRLLRSTGRSLRLISQEEFSTDGLEGEVAGSNVAALRGKYTVLHERVGSWGCTRCTMQNSTSDFRCLLCYAMPPTPAETPALSHPLRAAEVAALQSRFAVRPRINWAVHLHCPLCRTQGCASLATLPDLREAPSAWFHLADLDGSGQMSHSELIRALSAILPLSPEVLRVELADIVPADCEVVSLASFLREGGPAHWAAQQLVELEQQQKHS